MARLTQDVINRLLPAVARALRKAFGDSGFGKVTIDFKEGLPKVEWENRDREHIDGE